MSDDLPAQACVVFCALFSWLSMLRRGDGVLSLSLFVRRRRGGRGADVLDSTSSQRRVREHLRHQRAIAAIDEDARSTRRAQTDAVLIL